MSVLVVYTIIIHLTTKSSNIPNGNSWRWMLRQSDEVDLFNKSGLMMILASIAAAVSLPMLLEGILHMPSLPVLTMLFVSFKPL